MNDGEHIVFTVEEVLTNEMRIELHGRGDPRWKQSEGRFTVARFDLSRPRVRRVAGHLRRAIALISEWRKPFRMELRNGDSRELVDVAWVEAFLTQHLQGRVPTQSWSRLNSGLSVAEIDVARRKFVRLVDESSLAAHSDYIANLLRPSIAIERVEEDLVRGQSKYGGHPDLPKGVEWPRHDDGPHEFVAQLNFGEFQTDGTGLPDTGLLSVFAATRPYDSVFWQDEGYIRAIYTPAGTQLVPTETPPLSDAQHEEYEAPLGTQVEFALDFVTCLGLPNGIEQRGDWPVDGGQDTAVLGPFVDELAELWRQAVGELAEPIDHLLGYPSVSSLAYDPTPGPEWLPLISLRSHDELSWCWHDGDPLHVFIERERLENRDFSNLRADAG